MKPIGSSAISSRPVAPAVRMQEPLRGTVAHSCPAPVAEASRSFMSAAVGNDLMIVYKFVYMAIFASAAASLIGLGTRIHAKAD